MCHFFTDIILFRKCYVKKVKLKLSISFKEHGYAHQKQVICICLLMFCVGLLVAVIEIRQFFLYLKVCRIDRCSAIFHIHRSHLILPLPVAKKTVCEETLFADFTIIHRPCIGYILNCCVCVTHAVSVALRWWTCWQRSRMECYRAVDVLCFVYFCADGFAYFHFACLAHDFRQPWRTLWTRGHESCWHLT